MKLRQRLFSVYALLLAIFIAPNDSRAQWGMQFSVDTYLVQDGLDWLYLNSTAYDYSWGCSHFNYGSTSYITSPSNRTASGSQGGLSSFAALAINGEFGGYSGLTYGVFDCSCLGYQTSYGNNNNYVIRYPDSVVNDPSDGRALYQYNSPGNWLRRRILQTKDQFGQNWQNIGLVHEDLSITGANSCNITQVITAAETATDYYGKFKDDYGNHDGGTIITACTPPYNQTSCYTDLTHTYSIAFRTMPAFGVRATCSDAIF